MKTSRFDAINNVGFHHILILACIGFSSSNISEDIGEKVAVQIMTTIMNRKNAVMMHNCIRYFLSHFQDALERAVCEAFQLYQ